MGFCEEKIVKVLCSFFVCRYVVLPDRKVLKAARVEVSYNISLLCVNKSCCNSLK